MDLIINSGGRQLLREVNFLRISAELITSAVICQGMVKYMRAIAETEVHVAMLGNGSQARQ